MNILREAEYQSALSQLRHPEKRTWVILNPTSIGDTATICALASAFVKAHGHGITMVIPPDHAALVQMYPDRFARIVTMERGGMLYLINNYLDASRFELDVPFCAHAYDHGDGRLHNIMQLFKFPRRGGLSLNDSYRHLLRLPWDAKLERPIIPPAWQAEAEQIAEKAGMPKGKSVILFPANSSQHPQFRDVFWETLVARLKERGYTVFCNMKGGNFRPATMPIRGSIPIEVSMEHALPLVKHAGRVVSSANGMQFLQLLGGQFAQMTVAMPISSDYGDLHMNLRTYDWTAFLAQFMYPEMVLNMPFAEFHVPHDGPDEELKRVAVAMADDKFDDPRCLWRQGGNGQKFIDEQAEWLQDLIEPVAANQR
jgi:hypothetical protein